jgi:hypothetical protein
MTFMVSSRLSGSRSRKAVIAGALLIAVLAMSVYAYLASLPPAAGPLVTIASQPLQLSLQIDKTEYTIGENITIRFWLKNTSNKTITITYSDAYYYDGRFMAFDFIITSVNGSEIYSYGDTHGAEAAVTPFTLDAGQEINQTVLWEQTAWNQLRTEEVQVPAGTYYIRAAIPPGTANSMFGITGNAHGIRLETPSITFLIR